jgi:hypothetical protein
MRMRMAIVPLRHPPPMASVDSTIVVIAVAAHGATRQVRDRDLLNKSLLRVKKTFLLSCNQ